jgi:hypothetical protein
MMLSTTIAAWVVVTVGLIALSIHRSIFVTHEEDTIFISAGERATSNSYTAVIARLKRLEFILKIFSYASGALTILVAVMWIYQRLYG